MPNRNEAEHKKFIDNLLSVNARFRKWEISRQKNSHKRANLKKSKNDKEECKIDESKNLLKNKIGLIETRNNHVESDQKTITKNTEIVECHEVENISNSDSENKINQEISRQEKIEDIHAKNDFNLVETNAGTQSATNYKDFCKYF